MAELLGDEYVDPNEERAVTQNEPPPEDEGEPEPADGEEDGYMPSPVNDPQPGTGPSYPNYNNGGRVSPATVRPSEDYLPIASGSLFTAINAGNRPNGTGVTRPAEDSWPTMDISDVDLAAFGNRGTANPTNTTPVDPMIDMPTPRGLTLPARGGPNDPRAAFDELVALGSFSI